MNPLSVSLACLAFSTFAFSSGAGDARIAPPAECSMEENVTFSVNFNGTRDKIEDVQDLLKEKSSKLDALAKKAKLEKLIITQKNYNTNMQSTEQYQYNGSLSFTIKPAAKAMEFFKLLMAERYQTSINVNQYANGNCGQ